MVQRTSERVNKTPFVEFRTSECQEDQDSVSDLLKNTREI